MVLPLALIGASAGLSALGAASSYFGNRSAARRRRNAINQARRRNDAIDREQIAAEDQAGQGRDSALLGYLSSLGANQASGATAAANRRSAITAATGPAGGGLGSDSLASALYQQAMQRDAARRSAEDAGKVVSLGQQAQSDAMRSANAASASTAVPLANARYNAQVQRMQLQQWLADQLGTATNREANLGLMGNLLSAGGNAAGTFAGAANPGPTLFWT